MHFTGNNDRHSKWGRPVKSVLPAGARSGILTLLVCTTPALIAGPAKAEAPVLAPGYSALEFPAPIPGTYDLPALWSAGDAQVLDERGEPRRLNDLTGDKVVIMSFIYTHCNDVNGCPLATFVLSRVQPAVNADPELHDRVRLLTLSFDPARDTPEAMRAYGENFREPGFDWEFLTFNPEEDWQTVLESYDQPTQPVEGEDGVFSHVLRVYLLDENRKIRNIYNTSFLHADTLVSDIRTVLKN